MKKHFTYVSGSHIVPLIGEMKSQSELAGIYLDGPRTALIAQFMQKSYEYGCMYGYNFSQQEKQ